MKTRLPLASLVLASLLAAAPAAAQRSARVGLGVGLSSLDFGPLVSGSAPPAHLYVPIDLSARLRIEPQLGLVTFNGDPGDDFSRLDLGVGVLFQRSITQQLAAYVGPRVVLSFVSDEIDVGPGFDDATGIDARILGAVGGEYRPHPNFSFGVEGQLGFTAVGDKETDAGPEIGGGSSLHTGAIVFFRAFLL